MKKSTFEIQKKHKITDTQIYDITLDLLHLFLIHSVRLRISNESLKMPLLGD